MSKSLKRVLGSVLLSMSLSTVIPPTTATYASTSAVRSLYTKGVVTAKALNVRSGPSTSYKKIGKVTLGQSIDIIGVSSSNGWYKIKLGNTVGYVSNKYLRTSNNSTTTYTKGVVTAKALNVRSGPSTSYKRIGRVTLGQTVHVVGVNSSTGWYKIKFGNTTGYVSNKYLKCSNDSSDSTVNPLSILGQATITYEQAQEWARSRKASQLFINLAPIYWKYGELTGIRPEVLYAQSAKETKFGHFSGAVKPSMNNFAGIKTKKGGGDATYHHETFKTADDGVRAHFNHIGAYVLGKKYKPVGTPHDRFYVVLRTSWAGTIKTIDQFSARYAPSKTYGQSIINDFLNPMINTKTSYSVGTVKASRLNVRTGYSTKNSILGKLNKGDKVQIVKKLDNKWIKIKYNNTYAYVHGDYVI